MISKTQSFTDFAAISSIAKAKIQEGLRNEIGSNEYAISTCGEMRRNGKKKS